MRPDTSLSAIVCSRTKASAANPLPGDAQSIVASRRKILVVPVRLIGEAMTNRTVERRTLPGAMEGSAAVLLRVIHASVDARHRREMCSLHRLQEPLSREPRDFGRCLIVYRHHRAHIDLAKHEQVLTRGRTRTIKKVGIPDDRHSVTLDAEELHHLRRPFCLHLSSQRLEFRCR